MKNAFAGRTPPEKASESSDTPWSLPEVGEKLSSPRVHTTPHEIISHDGEGSPKVAFYLSRGGTPCQAKTPFLLRGVSRGRALRWAIEKTKGAEFPPATPGMLPALKPDPHDYHDIESLTPLCLRNTL